MKRIATFYTALNLMLLQLPQLVSAAVDPLGGLENIGTTVYGQPQPTDLRLVIGRVVQALLGFVGIIFLILIIWAGIQWMTSGGNEKKIQDAKRHLVNATIGLTIILLSFAVARFIVISLQNAASDCYPSGFVGPLPPGSTYCQ